MARLPLLTAPGRLMDWSAALCRQLERDYSEHRNRYGKILKPAVISNEVTIDLADADTFIVTLDDNVSTVTALLPRATDAVRFDFKLVLIQDGGGGNTWAWPAAWEWAGGTAPTISAGANAVDIFDFTVIDSVYYGRIFGQDMS